MPTKEEVYDTGIAPLMGRIIEICREAKIPLIACFGIDGEGDNEDLCCSTALLSADFNPPDSFIEAWKGLNPYKSEPIMITVEKPNGDKSITVVLGD